MDVHTLYYAHAQRRRLRNARKRCEEMGENATLNGNQLNERAANETIGFWMIPQDDGFLKLRIASNYYLNKRQEEVSYQIDGALLPVWTFYANSDLLQRHFPWISDDLIDDLVKGQPKRAAQVLVNRAMRAGWSYVIVKDNGIALGVRTPSFDSLPKYVGSLVDELTGHGIQMPQNIRVRQVTGSPRVHLFDASGAHRKSGSWEDFIGKVQDPGDNSELIDLVRQIDNPDQFQNLNEFQMGLFSPENLGKALAKASQQDREEIGDAIMMLITYYRRNEPEVNVTKLLSLAQKALTETTFHDLVRMTDQNGGYKNGGMVRVGNRWVTDPNVRGRSDNSFFVITRPPQVSIDEDGDVVMRYLFRSRSDRNTSGVAHSGYVKFLPDKGFFKRVGRAIQRFLRGESMWNRDVWCGCSCQDWRYRWAWVASKGGFSHPLGRPGDPTDQPPRQTNPDRKVSLCKHLYQLRLVLNNPPKSFKDSLERARRAAEQTGAQIDDKGDLVVEPTKSQDSPEVVQEVPPEERDDGSPPSNEDGIRPNP